MLLTHIQAGRRGNRQARGLTSRPRAFAVATIVCLVLLALLAVVQVAHIHPLETDADHCPLCIVMHAVAPVAAAAAVILLVQIGTPVPDLEARTIVRPWYSTLFTRPPPFAF
jgi:amino acid transporter